MKKKLALGLNLPEIDRELTDDEINEIRNVSDLGLYGELSDADLDNMGTDYD